ncbi:MAG: hypothetical protein HQ456_08155 [Polynucleobacter sp.]|jgi:hypothetical protein|nr:hypothetical protein [Polynucleobacter sp.]
MSKQIVPYQLEMANTWEDLYAHVDLYDVDLGPGDIVQLIDAPITLAYGQKRIVQGQAKYRKASLFSRFWTRFIARFEITMLYEVSFSSTRYYKNGVPKLHQKPI